MTENEMVGWYHQLSGHEFEQAPGDSEGQGNLACCSSLGHKESDTTQRLNNNMMKESFPLVNKVINQLTIDREVIHMD